MLLSLVAYSSIPLITSFHPWREALSELSEVAVDGVFTAVTWKPFLNTVIENFLNLSEVLSGWVSDVYISLPQHLSLPAHFCPLVFPSF